MALTVEGPGSKAARLSGGAIFGLGPRRLAHWKTPWVAQRSALRSSA